MREMQSVPSGFDFHHIGYATASIDQVYRFFERLGYRAEGDAFADPVQGVAGRFVIGGGPRIELLENLPGSHTLTPWLEAGIAMYHFAYWVDDIESALQWAKSQRGKVAVPPVPAIAFGGRRICFAIFRTRMMLEFIERRLTTS